MEQRVQNDGAGRQCIIRTEEHILAILVEYDRSGFNLKNFCEVSEIIETTFYTWIKKYRSKPDSEEITGLASIEVIPTLIHTMLSSRITEFLLLNWKARISGPIVPSIIK